jgi:putative protein kinase ArgK-like GTPase of G3E family
MLDLKYSSMPHPEPGQLFWRIPVLQAQALNNIGMDELFEALEKHHQYLGESGELQHRRKARRRRVALPRQAEVRRRLMTKARTDSAFAFSLKRSAKGRLIRMLRQCKFWKVRCCGSRIKRET